MKQAIRKLLVANRGEIAIRVMRTCQSMGISTVAVFSNADSSALFVKEADEAISLGGQTAAESYLNQDKIIDAAKRSGADAIHPGYGFLSENESFAERCEKEGFIFVGPSAKTIKAMGDKIRAKEIMLKHDVPVVPGYDGKDQSAGTLKKKAIEIGFPVLLKASAGGGGKGMRIVREEKTLEYDIEGAKREAHNAFGDDTLLIEKYFENARHIEFQIIGDKHGNVIHLFERECSIQRRYQKIIEESPSPVMTSALRDKMAVAALKAARAIKYDNAGTVEFIVDDKLNFYFLEVNTRLQVEHPVTEMITGLDLVKLQIEAAQGLLLPVKENDIRLNGHAIECRLYAEDPYNHFLPTTGKILCFQPAIVSGVRYDSGIESGSVIDIHYDPMIAKVVAHGATRSEAIGRMRRALKKTALLGIATNKNFLIDILNHPEFEAGKFNTHFISRHSELCSKKSLERKQLHEIATAATLWLWNQREEKKELLKHVPSGWRNNFFKMQEEKFSSEGNEVTVMYRFSERGFTVRIADTGFSANLISVSKDAITCEVAGHRKTFIIASSAETLYIHDDDAGSIILKIMPRFPEGASEKVKGGYAAPMPGEVVKVLVKPGDKVKPGDGLVILSSMKMENTIEAFEDGVVEEVFVEEKKFVEAEMLLVKIAPEPGLRQEIN
ncbi:MAG TPA: acetyl-CoA carboxylase biotin carboxylase subunit [Chitinophagales bacterium]|nr:acetyl-CoA carboxylase biotin carboxylase subunit [Chitinophagales bacterium]